MKLKRFFAAAVAILLLLTIVDSLEFKVPAKEDMYYYFLATAPAEDEAREFDVTGKYYGSGAAYGVAIMLIDRLESGEYQATVMWGYDASRYHEWIMTLHEQPGGRWTYDDCECSDITVDENQNLDVEVTYTGGTGYFTAGNWCFAWDGAKESGCRSIVFEK